jgi:hypothetical protein
VNSSINRFLSRARHSIIRSVVVLTDAFPADAPLQHAFLLRQLAACIPAELTCAEESGKNLPDLERIDACDSATASLATFLRRAEEAGHTSSEDIAPLIERIEDIRRLARHLRERTCEAAA